MLKRHEVEILLKAGHAKTEVGRLSGVSLRSVKRIAEERPVEHVDDARERVKRQIGGPSTVTNFRKQVVEIVRETPDLASLEILRRVKESGYPGGARRRSQNCVLPTRGLSLGLCSSMLPSRRGRPASSTRCPNEPVNCRSKLHTPHD